MSQNSRTKTQAAKVLELLMSGQWTPAYELARVGGLQFQTRVWELRHRLGLTIENRTERGAHGVVHSFYRLAKGLKPVHEMTTRPSTSTDEAVQQRRLFDTASQHLDLG